MTANDLFDVTGKVVIVTGGSRGLGRSMVLGFARLGANVVVASRKFDACQVVAEEVRAVHGRDALAVAANVSSWQDCERLVEEAYDRFGSVDVLVNNAGISPTYGSPVDVSESLWDKVLDVNLKGPFRLTTLVGDRMSAAGSGSIINISSLASIRANGAVLPYAAAKAGLNALTQGFAQALGPNVRVNTIMCGLFRTDIAVSWGDPKIVNARAQRTHALGRIGEPDEVVGAAVYLASNASSFCTGATLRLDGGFE